MRSQGGNDYEIYESERTIGHSVTSPMDTEQQCYQLFFKPAEHLQALGSNGSA